MAATAHPEAFGATRQNPTATERTPFAAQQNRGRRHGEDYPWHPVSGYATGPRTPEGKARVAGNAVKHGLTGSAAVLPEEDRDAFAQLRAGLLAEWQPRGLDERGLVERIAAATWKLQRAWRIETGIYEAWRGKLKDAAMPEAYVFLNDAEKTQGFLKHDKRESKVNRDYYAAVRQLLLFQELRRKGLRVGVEAAPLEVTATPVAAPPPVAIPADAIPAEPVQPAARPAATTSSDGAAGEIPKQTPPADDQSSAVRARGSAPLQSTPVQQVAPNPPPPAATPPSAAVQPDDSDSVPTDRDAAIHGDGTPENVGARCCAPNDHAHPAAAPPPMILGVALSSAGAAGGIPAQTPTASLPDADGGPRRSDGGDPSAVRARSSAPLPSTHGQVRSPGPPTQDATPSSAGASAEIPKQTPPAAVLPIPLPWGWMKAGSANVVQQAFLGYRRGMRFDFHLPPTALSRPTAVSPA